MWLASLRHCLAGLARFSGRDGPARFWPYTGTLFGIAMAFWSIYMGTLMSGMFARMRAFARTHPDQVTVEQGPGHYSMQIHGSHPELMPDFASALTVIAVISLCFIVMVAAAAARRLHDSGIPGWVGLVPVVFLLSGFWLMRGVFGSMDTGAEPDFDRFLLIFGNNLVYLICLGVLAYLLARKGTPGDNRYGPPG
ncbi:MAG: DUF805 domain-containing protein [Novosphingobium sp.]|jgi:uncharacterized membrane protein YhaH (DUF805 family)|nr:DUF805 domain-containing protein [Novosphingobium sp.]